MNTKRIKAYSSSLALLYDYAPQKIKEKYVLGSKIVKMAFLPFNCFIVLNL